MESNKLSLIVINYNGQKLLSDYFKSLFQQTLVPDEVFMVDNMSTDQSVKFVKKNYHNVKIIQNPNNFGTAKASNSASTYVTGDFIIFQNNDIILDKNCIQNLILTIKKDSNIGICTSVSIYYDKAKQQKIVENAGGTIDVYGFNWPIYNSKRLEDIPELSGIFLTYGNSFILRKTIFEQVGGFDNRFFTLNDDVDLSWRIRLQGYKIVCSRKSFIYHKGHATLGPLFPRSQKRYWAERNCCRTLLKNYGISSLVQFFPTYLALLFSEMCYYLWRGRFDLFASILKAIIWNLIYFPDTIFERMLVQKNRKISDFELIKNMERNSFKLKHWREFAKSI